jgi:hypothetical protein
VRGLALLAVAVLLGIILLNSADNPRGATLAAGKSANGTSVNGAGARVGTTLKAAGYDVLAATSVVQPARASVIYFLPGFDREAAAVAVVLNLPATAAQPLPAPPPFDTKGANVTVLIGPDLAGATSPTGVQPTTASTHPGTTTPGRSTTTTAHSATTTTRKP